MIEPQALLLLSRLNVQNANAISTPLVWGFPSPTSFLGFVEALSRALQPTVGITLEGVGVVCHRFDPQVSRPSGKRTNVFKLTRNPVDKDGKSASLVEEGRTHLEVSLVIGASGEVLDYEDLAVLSARVAEFVGAMRLAGGSLVPDSKAGTLVKAEFVLWPGSEEAERKLARDLRRRLLPGFALVSREALLEERLGELRDENAKATMLDAFLDLSGLHIEPTSVEDRTEWRVRPRSGWIVPIAAGYQGISELYSPGAVQNARDRTTPFRFVEGLYTVGQWLSPHRVTDIRQLLWTYAVEPAAGVYRCTTPYFANLSSQTEGPA